MANLLELSPHVVRRIDRGEYWLFNMPCPTEVMAAYERTWARRGNVRQQDGDLLVAWVVQNSLINGDFDLASKLRDALEELGWRPRD